MPGTEIAVLVLKAVPQSSPQEMGAWAPAPAVLACVEVPSCAAAAAAAVLLPEGPLLHISDHDMVDTAYSSGSCAASRDVASLSSRSSTSS